MHLIQRQKTKDKKLVTYSWLYIYPYMVQMCRVEVGWLMYDRDQCYCVCVCVCMHLNRSRFFFQHICVQGFVSSSVIGQSTVKGPEICKLRQIWRGAEGKRIVGLLLSDRKSAVGWSQRLTGRTSYKNTGYVLSDKPLRVFISIGYKSDFVPFIRRKAIKDEKVEKQG